MRTAPYPNSSLSRTPTGLITLQRVPPPRVLPPIAQHIIGLSPQSQTPPGWFEGARVSALAAAPGTHRWPSMWWETFGLTLSTTCRSIRKFWRAWSDVVNVEVTTSPVNKIFRADPTEILNAVIVAIPFDW